jgi:hypothetical protein
MLTSVLLMPAWVNFLPNLTSLIPLSGPHAGNYSVSKLRRHPVDESLSSEAHVTIYPVCAARLGHITSTASTESTDAEGTN